MASVSESLTRLVDGRPVPAAGTWVFEAGNSEIAFTVKHMMISRVRGAFREFSGEITVADRPEDSSVSVTIQAASIDTGLPFRDKDLRGPEFLDVDTHPTLDFRSTSVAPRGNGWQLRGDLAIAGRTREVALDMQFQGATVDPWGNTKAVFSASVEIVREEWGLTYNRAVEGGGVLIGPTVKIEIEVQAKPKGVAA